MRSPRGLGVGRLGATVIATVLGLTALAAAPAIGTEHLENEGAEAPKAAKIIVIAPDQFTGLVGAKRTFWATICDQDGSACKDANKAKWSVVPKKGLVLSKKKGVQILAEGKRAGSYELTARQNGVSGRITIKINEPVERAAPEPVPELRVYMHPAERMIKVGELGTFHVFGCRNTDTGRLGENGIPDGVDDECIELDIEALIVDAGAPVAVIGPEGNAFGLYLEHFPAGVDGDRSFIGAQVQTAIGSTLGSIIAENELFREGSYFGPGLPGSSETPVVPTVTPADARIDPGELLPGDLDGDDRVTNRDYWAWHNASYDMPMPLNNPESLLDADGDGQVTPRDGRWIQLEAFRNSSAPFGDADHNGKVDRGDGLAAFSAFFTPRYNPALDHNGDLVLDQSDWEALGYGPGPMPTPSSSNLTAEKQAASLEEWLEED